MFELNGYSIVTSLNERNIYIKCIDQLNFINYENNVDQKELRLHFELIDIYSIINKCFNEEKGFSVTFNVSSGLLKLTFNALVGGFLKVSFETLLREKILSNDGQLTMKFNIMEQKYQALAKKFERFIKDYNENEKEKEQLMNAISNAEIILSPHQKSGQCTIFPEHIYKINSKSIIIECYVNKRYGGNMGEPTLERINEFYQLEKLELNYYRCLDLTGMKNNTLVELKLNVFGDSVFTSILGINNFPNLRKLEIYSAPSITDIVKVLSSVDKKHNINTIILSKCSSINVVEIQTYCQINNIQLNIS